MSAEKASWKTPDAIAGFEVQRDQSSGAEYVVTRDGFRLTRGVGKYGVWSAAEGDWVKVTYGDWIFAHASQSGADLAARAYGPTFYSGELSAKVGGRRGWWVLDIKKDLARPATTREATAAAMLEERQALRQKIENAERIGGLHSGD